MPNETRDTPAGRNPAALLGIRMNGSELPQLVARAVRALDEPAEAPFTFACANPHSLVVAQRDAYFRQCLRSCSAVVADGIGVKVAGLLTGRTYGPRITGWDFFHATMRALDARGGKAFFLGSTPEVLERIRQRSARDYPNVVLGLLSPPFGDWSSGQAEEVLETVRGFSPDVLWVGMTAPRQEKWMHANSLRSQAPVIGAVGAVFDYYAGTVRRAPSWVCSAGLEWLYRLAGEPGRLWKRTLVSAPRFLWLVALDRLLPVATTDTEAEAGPLPRAP